MPRYQSDAPTTVVETWGLRPGWRVWVGGHNVEAKQEIERHLAGVEHPPTGPIDLGLIAPQTADEALYFAGKLCHRLAAGGIVWIAYPNPRFAGNAGLASQFDELTVGMFERGFGEAGGGALNDQYSMIGFRFQGRPDEP